MRHVFRFHIAPGHEAHDEVALSGDEAHHALHVARVSTGDTVTLFDGEGLEISGVVSGATRREVLVRSVERRHVPRPANRLTILQAFLHRDKSTDFLIQRVTELGVARICFFRARRSDKEPRMSAKWHRIAVEACKQCGRSWLPAFEIAPDLETALASVRGTLAIATADLEPAPLRQAVAPPEMTLLVGPEGDFAPEELDLARGHGAIPISLGTVTYRSEVAASLAASLILYELGELGERLPPSGT